MDMIYLDNNATTRPAPQVVDAMTTAMREAWANPSSVHRFGQSVRQQMDLARAAVAELVGCRDRDLIFTSGGTESNNLALRGSLEGRDNPVLITTAMEHAAIREPAEALAARGATVVDLDVDADGRVIIASLEAALTAHLQAGASVLVSVQWANNETGIIQPIEAIAAAVKTASSERKALLHVDATQAVGKLPVDFASSDIDMATFAAHKFHGPKGAGALYVRRGVKLTAQTRGGPQERERRGGTENTFAIIGMGEAARLAQTFINDTPRAEALAALRDQFERNVIESVKGVPVTINGQTNPATPRLWNTTNLGFARLEAEAILLGLSERGVCASAGAACSSGSLDPSPVLLAMGIAPEVAHGSVRFSLSRDTTADEVDRAATITAEVIARLARTMPV